MKGSADVVVHSEGNNRYTVIGRWSQLPVMEIECRGIPSAEFAEHIGWAVQQWFYGNKNKRKGEKK